jgi:polysaccharide chain length determinant protein (PEP-CTERM system associated)
MHDIDSDAPDLPRRGIVEYLEIPFWYPRHVWIPFVVVFLAAVSAIFVLPKKYRSATLILVEPVTIPNYFVLPMASEGIDKRLHSIRQLILSRTRLENVARQHNPYPELAGAPIQSTVESMRKAIQIRVQGTDSFSIEYVNADPKKAMDVTNALAAQFIEDAAYLRENMTAQAYAFLRSNLATARQELEAREAALREHKTKYWGALPEQLDANLRLLQQLQLEQQTVAENMRTLEERRGLVEQNLADARRQAAAGETLAGAASPATELAKLRAALEGLRDRYTEEHPDVRALRHRIERLETAAGGTGERATGGTDAAPEVQALHRSLRSVENQIDLLTARRAAVDRKITAFQARIEQTPKAEQELMALTRDYQQLRDKYNEMLKKEMDAESAVKLEEQSKGGYFKIIDPAHFPHKPIRPYATILLGGGLVGGLLIGLLCALAADFLDSSVKHVRDLESLLPCPVLATLPHATTAKRRRRSRRAPVLATT